MKVLVVLCTSAAVAIAGAAGAASASSALVVDDDRVQCPQAEFTSIQAAVNAASPGSTVLVCPGLYNEQVTVTKEKLTLRAQQRAVRDCFAAVPEPFDPTAEALVSGGPAGTAIAIAADGVSVVGFVVYGSEDGIDSLQSVSGFRIEQNVVTGNLLGLPLGSSGAEPSRVLHNCIRDNGSGPAGGGIVSLVFPTGPRVLNNARIDHNEFFRNNFGVRLGASRDVTVDHNTSQSDATWMRNGGVIDVSVTHNRIGGGSLYGIVFIPLGGAGVPNENVVVSHNEISNMGRDGVQASAPLGVGTALIDSLISHNTITANGRDGIRIEAGLNGGNLIEHNALAGNGAHDCRDDTVGAGTGGTANTWEKNRGETQNRPDLCEGATVVAGP
jgi:Right handed beta helix region